MRSIKNYLGIAALVSGMTIANCGPIDTSAAQQLKATPSTTTEEGCEQYKWKAHFISYNQPSHYGYGYDYGYHTISNVATGDMNNDSNLDVIISAPSGWTCWYENPGESRP
jgi:hypothetical protein